MIVKNEEHTLSACLDSVADLVDEMIIVDTGSTDHTKDIALRYTKQVYDYVWEDDFAAARNASFSKASSEFCMWLDADDVILKEDRENLAVLKENLSLTTDFVMCRYHTGFDVTGKPVYSYYRERIIRNHKNYIWKGAVHETIVPSGNILYTDIAVTHTKTHSSDPERNLRIFRKKLEKGARLEAREQFYYARELWYAGNLDQAVQAMQSFLDSGEGWMENNIEACRILARCYFGMKEEEKAVAALLRSLMFDVPRAELCCDLGAYFIGKEKYQQASFWYHTALGCKRNDASGGFVETDCYGYIPYIQLCLCCERQGMREEAYEYNEKAGQCKPQGAEYLHNKEFFNR